MAKGFTKQQVLPPLQTKEVLASLIWLYLFDNRYLTTADDDATKARYAARREVHLANLRETGIVEGVLEESDILPF